MKSFDKNIRLVDIISDCSIQELKKILKTDIDIDETDSDGRSPLNYACRLGLKSKVKILIQHGANVNSKDLYSDTPLHWSCLFPNYEIIKFLIINGADINAKNYIGNTPINIISKYDDYEKTIKLFIEHGSNLFNINSFDDKNYDLNNLLKISYWQKLVLINQLNNIDILKKYIKFNTDIKTEYSYIFTASNIGII